MSDIQEKLLELMEFFHNFCYENNIKYYAIGGTALGAARHQGFIPWDDDLDVGVPREDYERLKKMTYGKTYGKYIFEFPGQSKDFVYPFCKMYDTTTTLVENTRYETRRGIFIDLFPLDGVGNTKEESISNLHKVDRLYNLLETKLCAVRKGRAWYKNMAVRLMQLVPDFIVDPQKIMSKIDIESQKRKYYLCKYVANLVGNGHEKEIVRRECFGEGKLYKFHDITIVGPDNIDEYLTGIYGDWRQLPPIDKQVTHHDFIKLDLNKSYLN